MSHKVAGYIRTSRIPQETLEMQKESIMKLYLQGTEFSWYEEQVSGWDGSVRHEYDTLKRRIDAGQVKEVCMYSVSRLGRNVQEAMAFISLCHQRGVKVRVVLENLDFSGPMGHALFTLFSALAQMESDRKSKTIKDVFNEQKRKGTFIPHGHVKGCVNTRIKRQAPHVYAMHDAGQSNAQIAMALSLTEHKVADILRRRGELLLTMADYAAMFPGWHLLPKHKRPSARGIKA